MLYSQKSCLCFFLHFRWSLTTSWYSMHVSHVLISLLSVLCFISTSLLETSEKDCGRNHYFDPVTSLCQPCSDCSNGRTGNIYCENKCLKGKTAGTGCGVILVMIKNNLRLLRLQSNCAIIEYEHPLHCWETTAATQGSTRPIYRRVKHF